MKLTLALLGLLATGAGLYLLFLAAPGPEVKEVAPLPQEMDSPAITSSSSTAISTAAERAEPPRAPPAPITSSTPPPPTELSAALDEASRSLPTMAELRKLPAVALHRTPAPVMKANAAIGQVAEAIEREPARAGEGLAFYGDCARRADVATSVRALCLTKMRQLSKTSGLPAVEDGIAAEVKDLSDFTLR